MEKRMGAAFLGTFWLAFAGCGSAVLAFKFLDAQNSNVN
jgi:glycerol uptake facilitator-like aquaporin